MEPFLPRQMPEKDIKEWLKRIQSCQHISSLKALEKEIQREQDDSPYNDRDLRFNIYERIIWREFEERREKIDDDAFFRSPIQSRESEIVNGFSLYDSNDYMTIKIFEQCEEAVQNDIPFKTFREFWQAFDETCCSDWSKQTPDGESFKGFYSSVNLAVKDNAYYLTRFTNAMRMWHLPFPKSLLLFTIRLGCPIRMESVRFSNFVCVLYYRKKEARKKVMEIEEWEKGQAEEEKK